VNTNITVRNGGDLYSAQKAEQINDYLFIDTYMSHKLEIGMLNEMRVNASECEMENKRSSVDTGDISPEIGWTTAQRIERYLQQIQIRHFYCATYTCTDQWCIDNSQFS